VIHTKEETQLLILTKRQFRSKDAKEFSEILERMTGKHCVIIPEIVSGIVEVSRNSDNGGNDNAD